MIDLSSAREKLRRAQLHLNEAETISNDLIYRYFHTGIGEPDGDGWHLITLVAAPPPSPDLALAIGDAANCLRSALDHMTFACVIGEPTPQQEKTIEFPICETVDQWNSAHGKLVKWLSPEALALIHNFQPGPSPKHTGSKWLAVVREVNNRDKHRGLSIIASLGKRFSVTPAPPEALADCEIFPAGRLEVGTKLARFKVTEGFTHENVKMDRKLVVVPVFGEKMPDSVVGFSAINSIIEANNFIMNEVLPAFGKL